MELSCTARRMLDRDARHIQIGYDLVKRIPFLADAPSIILTHHERWDGSGYPRGLKADEIPLGARIFAIADSVDAMTSDRPHRLALPLEEAMEEIHRGLEAGPVAMLRGVVSRSFSSLLSAIIAWLEFQAQATPDGGRF